MNIEKLDYELYKKLYRENDMVNAAYLWENIKKNKEILKHSIKKTQYDTVSCMAICQYILIDYENVDENIYQELINLIYSNVDIARTVLSDSKYEGYSYLMLSLFNNNLKLTEAQKKFAVREAMNKKGTTYFNKLESDYRKRTGFDKDALDFNMTIKEKEQALISRYFDYLNNIWSLSQLHGNGDFDIRYQILRNPNWNFEEKKKLVYDFYEDDEDWYEHLKSFEIKIINDDETNQDSEYFISHRYIYEYSYEDILKLCPNEEIANRIWEEIQFCEDMKNIRPPKLNKTLKFEKKRTN